MRIVVASRNPVKVDATRRAFNELFPDASLEVGSVDVESGVSDQPKSDEEALPLPPDGRYTRESVYRQTLIIALTPFVNSLYPDAKCAT